MPMTADEIERHMKAAFPDAEMTLTDLAGDNDHWALEIASAAFAGKSRVAQQQLVYAALKGQMGGTLHALQLKTIVK